MAELSEIKIDGVTYDIMDAAARKNSVAITGAEVGQTVRIAEVDSNGVPVAWEAVSLSSDGVYNTIEGFITEEEVQAIYKGLEEQKAIIVTLRVPTGAEQFYIQVYTNHKSGKTIRVVLNFNQTNSTMGSRVEVYPEYGYFTGTGYQPSAAYSNSGTSISLSNDAIRTIPENDPIVGLSFVAYGNKTIPIGTYIHYWGVKA